MTAAVPAPVKLALQPALDLPTRIRALEAELRDLRCQLDHQLLAAFANVVGDRVFSASELWRHAQAVSGELRAAFDQAGITSVRVLGKRLRRVGERSVHAEPKLRLERVGVDHHVGALWIVRGGTSV